MQTPGILDLMTVESAQYKEKYSDILAEVESFYESEYNGKVKLRDLDAYALGKYASTVETYSPYMEGDDVSGLRNTQDTVRHNLGLTATQYATSVIPLIASVQPTEQEVAILYYKEAVATTSRGGVNEGDTVQSRFGHVNSNMDKYISDEQVNNSTKFTETANTSDGFTIQLLKPVRPGSVSISIGGKAKAIDNGEGAVFGSYIDPTASSINYDSGVLKLKLTGHSSLKISDNTDIEVVYSQLVFNNDSIAGFKYQIKAEPVAVRYYPLQVTYDAVNNFVTKRQFGQAISDFANKDLVYQINKAVSGQLIKEMKVAAIRNEASGATIKWDPTAPTGVSTIEHRATFRDIYDLAISGMEKISGLGGVSAVIVGAEGRKIYNALGIGSVKSKPGAYVLGFDGDIVIIYASSDFIDADEVLLVHKGDYFETAAIYCPFLPVLSIDVQGRDHNVFQKTHGVATGAAMKVVNPGFVQRVKLSK